MVVDHQSYTGLVSKKLETSSEPENFTLCKTELKKKFRIQTLKWAYYIKIKKSDG